MDKPSSEKLGRILIRRMKEEDIGSVVGMEKTSFSLPWSETSFIKELYRPRSIPKVAVLDDRIVGYVCIDYVTDEGHILNLSVHPDYRKRGVATALVEDAVEELKLKACRFVYLEVRASNYAAKKLYKGFGFSVVGVRKNYYVAPLEDAVIMMLEI
jgi:ribosomal-protein-alanine N-acetyltransferase